MWHVLDIEYSLFYWLCGWQYPFAVANSIEDVMRSLEVFTKNLIIWFSNNLMKLNADKYHHLLLNTKGVDHFINTKEQTVLEIGNLHIKKFLVGKIIMYKFRLQAKLCKAYWTYWHIDIKHIDICQNASRKLNALARLGIYKHTKKVKNSQAAILILIWAKHKLFPVSIVKTKKG